jgi:hypothetical protein
VPDSPRWAGLAYLFPGHLDRLAKRNLHSISSRIVLGLKMLSEVVHRSSERFMHLPGVRTPPILQVETPSICLVEIRRTRLAAFEYLNPEVPNDRHADFPQLNGSPTVLSSHFKIPQLFTESFS